MIIGSIVEDDGTWWRQVVDRKERTWTIRVRIGTIAGTDIYECWVNDMMLPVFRPRDPENDESELDWIFNVALHYVKGEVGCC
jgi:hypothetical protein